MVSNKYTAFALFLLLFLIFTNVLDFVYSTVITRTPYSFSAGGDLFVPLVTAAVLGYVLILRKED